MKRFKFFHLQQIASGTIILKSTDGQVVEGIVTEIQKQIAECEVYTYGNLSSLPFDGTCEASIENLSGEEVRYLFLWVMKLLCSQGWEPFAVEGDNEIHLRYEEIHEA